MEFEKSETPDISGSTDLGTLGLESPTSSAGPAEPLVVKSSWKSLFAFTKWNQAGVLTTAITSAALVAAFRTVLAVILGRIFDVIADFGSGTQNGSHTLSAVSRWCLILVGLGIGNWIANSLFLALWVAFGELQADSVRQDIFNILLSRNMAWFDSLEQGISSLLVRIQTQTRELQLATSQVFGLLVCDATTSIASLGVALSYSWKLTLVLLATLPISILALSLASRKLEPAIQAQKRNLAKASKLATASMTAIDLVKVFNGYDREIWQYHQATQLAGKNYLVQALCNSMQMGYIAFWVVGLFVVGFWYGVVLVNQGLGPGDVLTAFYATLSAFQGIEALVPHWLVLSKGMSAGAFLSTLTSKTNNQTAGTKMARMSIPAAFGQCVGDVELTDVSFAYPSNPTKNVLNSSSFFFPSGELTFIVGRSGSGKSTIGNLVANFYKPLTGDVQLDGNSVFMLDEKWIQSKVTLIQQSSVLFNDTFFNNIAFGHPCPEKATREEVISACESALLQSTLADLPQGLETNIGPSGYNLSGGQKQRVTLARARLRDPPVLILDEVTSGLDQFNRTLVMDAVRQWRKGKTTIIITHDVTQIEDDDFLYVMENANLVQQGFKRHLVQVLDGPFVSLMNLSPLTPGPTSFEINVVEPTSPARTERSHFIRPVSSRSSISKLFFDGLKVNRQLSSQPGLSRPTSLTVETAQALHLRTEPLWDGANYSLRLSAPKRRKSWWITQMLEIEMRNFSVLIDKHFSSPREHTLEDLDGGCRGHVMEERDPLTESDGPERGPEDPSFIFGASDRRDNIPELRLHQSTEDPNISEKDAGTLPAKATKKDHSLTKTIRTVWPALGKRQRATLVLGLLSCLIAAAATPAFSYCFAQLLGAMWSSGDKMAEGRRWALYLVAIAVVDGISTGAGRYLLEIVGQAWVDGIRVEALRRILRQPKSWFDKKQNSPGRLNECLERNSEEMRNIVGKFIPIITIATGMILISVIWALAVSWKLTLVALGPLPAVMGAVKGYAMISGKWEEQCNKGAEDASAVLTEVFLNIRVVKALTLEKHFESKYGKAVADTLRLGLKRGAYTCALFGLYQSMSYALTALVFYYGAVLLAKGNSTEVSQILEVVNLLLFSIGTATEVLGGMPQLTMAQATAVQMLEYAKMPLEGLTKGRRALKLATPLPINMSDLKFSYPRRFKQQVLHGVSMTIRPGDCTAIVGPSGCGKSTIVSLLLGLHSPSETVAAGSFTFGGVPSSLIDMDHFRSTIAYVPQAPFLFPASIAENIAYGLEEGPSHHQTQSIYRAAKAAGLHDFIISLPSGYNTIIGDGGQSLSGGQAQRLSIARALVRQPLLLIMDEPTSALDSESSYTIRQTIRGLVSGSKNGRTGMAIVLVTHSVDMMRVADNIVVLNDGVKVDEGGFDELWTESGPFRHLVKGGEWMQTDDAAGPST